MNVDPPHGIDAIRLLVHDVLVVEEELFGFHELWLALSQLIAFDLVFQNVRELKIIVTNGLATKHNHGICVDHVKADQPNLLLSHDVNNLPVASLCVELLDRSPIRKSLISHCVYVALREGAAIRPSNCLT